MVAERKEKYNTVKFQVRIRWMDDKNGFRNTNMPLVSVPS